MGLGVDRFRNIQSAMCDRCAHANVVKHVPVLPDALLVGLFFCLSGGVVLIVGDVESSLLAKVFWSLIYLIVITLIYHSSRPVLDAIIRNPGYFIVTMTCLFSIFWSSDRSASVTGGIGLLGTTLLAYFLTAKVEAEALLIRIATALFLLMLLNALLLLPNASANLTGAIRYSGIFTHPNVLGRTVGLATLILVGLSMMGHLPASIGALAGLMGGLLLIACESVTSTLALSLALGVLLLRRLEGQPIGGGYLASIAWVALCSFGILYLYWSPFLEWSLGLLGRSSNFTGRIPLWEGVWDAIMQRPFTGYGYEAFWSGEPVLGKRIHAYAGWSSPNAHNGLLDMALHIGLFGVIVFVCTVGRSFFLGFKLTFMRDESVGILFFCILIYLLVLGLTESCYLTHNSDKWVLFVLCSAFIERSYARRHQAASCSIKAN